MKLFNTITKKKEEFKPINDKIVTMYVCGPTVYDLFHIGNARTFVVFDVVRRYLEYKGYSVKFIQNFTDIDDKIINKSIEQNKDVKEISEKYIEEYYIDADSLNIKRARLYPKATENIEEMIKFISRLIKMEFAYENNGDVYFRIKNFDNYGVFGKENINGLMSGARIEVNKNKECPLDFIVWKKSKKDELGYDSPWGVGRPGWHTECCSMIYKYFNETTIDIHCGGIDLVFPHHENEVAQIESITGKSLSNYWLHCAFVNINDEKMSKSSNNFFTTREILKKFSGNVLRFFILSSHYRTEISFSEEQLVVAEKSLGRIYKTYNNMLYRCKQKDLPTCNKHMDNAMKFKFRFFERMDDDFNTADSISIIFEMIKYINSFYIEFNFDELQMYSNLLEQFLEVLGLKIEDINKDELFVDDYIRQIIIKRAEFRKNKDFASADLIRDELLAKKIILEDINGGVRVLNSDNGSLIEVISY